MRPAPAAPRFLGTTSLNDAKLTLEKLNALRWEESIQIKGTAAIELSTGHVIKVRFNENLDHHEACFAD